MTIYTTPAMSDLWRAAKEGAQIPPGSLAERLARACGGAQAAIDSIAAAISSVERPPSLVPLPGMPDALVQVQRSAILLILPATASPRVREAALEVAEELTLTPSTGSSWVHAPDNEGLIVLRLTLDKF